MKFNVGDLFLVCDEGFDFKNKIRKSDIVSTVYNTSFFENNHLKYLEIVSVIKHRRRKKYKVRLFWENKKVTDNMWCAYSRSQEPQELFKWIYPTILRNKLKCGAIQPWSWAYIAKETLLDGENNEELLQ